MQNMWRKTVDQFRDDEATPTRKLRVRDQFIAPHARETATTSRLNIPREPTRGPLSTTSTPLRASVQPSAKKKRWFFSRKELQETKRDITDCASYYQKLIILSVVVSVSVFIIMYTLSPPFVEADKSRNPMVQGTVSVKRCAVVSVGSGALAVFLCRKQLHQIF
jgi:hypothetical protein